MFLNSKTIDMSSSQTVTNNTNTLFGSDAEHTPNPPIVSTLSNLEAKPQQQPPHLTNVFSNFYRSFIKYTDLWNFSNTCKLLFKFKKYLTYKINRDCCLLKYNKDYYKHCNLCKVHTLNLAYRNILICNITHAHTLSFLSYSNSRTCNIIDVKDLVDEYTSELSYCNKITYTKKLVPYYTKKAKHFSQKRVFHHKK